jgi:cation:H+ antiporter
MNGMITTLMPYIWFTVGLAVLVFCGNILVTGSVQLARYFKISSLVVGLTIVAYGTSAPEMFISIGAALNGANDIALGNVIGSNIANIGIILAVVVIICPIPIENKSFGFNLLFMFLVTILLFIFAYNGVIGRIEGICFLTLLAAYTAWSVITSRKKMLDVKVETSTIKPLFAALMIITAIIGLYFSSGWLVGGAREIALRWGVSERVIAISIVAVGTSMPEFTASLIAAFRKEPDLSIGNIIGSNLFNIAGVLGVTTVVRPIPIASLSMFTYDMIWLFGISIALVLTMIPLTKGKMNRWEGGILLLIFMTYMVLLFRNDG